VALLETHGLKPGLESLDTRGIRSESLMEDANPVRAPRLLRVGRQRQCEQPEGEGTDKPDVPEPHKGLLYCYEGTNITEEKVVKKAKMQFIDALIESYAVKNETGYSMWTGAGLRISFTG